MKRSRSGHWARLLVVATTLSLIASACSAQETTDTTTGTSVSTTTSSDTTAPSSDSSTTMPEEPSDRPELLQVYLNTQLQHPFNPLETTRQGNRAVFSILYEPIVFVDNQNEISSRLLESWEVSDDARTVTLNVATGLLWNDGEPITAEDVRMTLEIYLDTNLASLASRIGGVVGVADYVGGTATDISGLTVDGSTVTVELDPPNVAWLANLAALGFNLPVLPSHAVGEIPRSDLLESDYWASHAVTSGPYQYVAYQTDQFVELEANPNWSFGTPAFDGVIMRMATTDVATAQLETGELHAFDLLAPADAARLEQIDGITVESVTGVAPEGMVFDWPDPQLNDPRIRQAIMHAIDRESICRTVLGGYCTVPLTNVRLISPEWAIPTEGMIEYHYDPDRARELLSEAGWIEGDTLVLYHTPGLAYQDQHVVLIQGFLDAVGINVEIVNIETGPKVDAGRTAEGREGFSFFIQSGADFTVDPSSVEPYTRCDMHRSPTGGANSSWYCNPTLDELWDAGRQTGIQSERADIYHEAFRILNADPPNGWLFVRDTIVAYDSRLTGIAPLGSASGLYWNIGDWDWAG
jgi:peptide/nickel transport system substrate-binding protein